MKQTKNRYKNNGPLVFKPFNERSAFKPIVSMPKSSTDTGSIRTDTTLLSGDSNTNDGNGHEYNAALTTAPRICGTSLKRHISNVETYNRARSTDEMNSMSDDDDCANVTPTSPSSASTARGKRLHYADLAPLRATFKSTLNTNLRLINCTTGSSRNNSNNNSIHDSNGVISSNDSNNNGISNSSASSNSNCTIRPCDRKKATDINPNERDKTDALPVSPNASLPIQTTQYATLKFDEVNIWTQSIVI